MLLATDVAYCEAIHRKHGKSYYFATKFFSRELREATFVLYAFFRVPDDVVDFAGERTQEDVRAELSAWREKWRSAYATGESDHPVLRATAEVFSRYGIPFEYSEAFLDAMEQDVFVDSYATYEDLKGYMYGSAAVVGLMMTYVIGYSDARALGYAEALGYAMQLTNFLRDVDEDMIERGRVYLPEEDLKRFGVTREQIVERRFDDAFKQLMQFEIARARALYREADLGIPMLNRGGRFSVRVASRLYEAILEKLEAQDCNPFLGRARTSFFEKCLFIAPLLWQSLKERT